MTWFTITDFNKGYWMVELHPDSRKLDIGRFQWTRLPMSSIIAQDMFQWKLDAIFLSVPGITGIADDMIIFGKTDQEHDGNPLNFLEVCRTNHLTLNPEKMQSRLPKVSFFGHTQTDKGLSADPKKIKAVKRMEIPQDVETRRSFLGLINHLNCFSPRLTELSDPLREICRQKVEFQLTRACEIAFQCCKEEISKNITLPYYNPKSLTILQTDASKRGLGGSSTTTKLYSSNVCIQSIDWKWEELPELGERLSCNHLGNGKVPLFSLWKRNQKHMVEISPRIQRLVVRSFPYQPFKMRYRKGVVIPLADDLSRVTPLPMEEDEIKLPIIAVNQVTANIPYSSNELDQIFKETRKDPTLKLLMHYILIRWPCDQRQLPQELHPYWNYMEDLSVEDGHATKGSRLLIPSTLWRKPLNRSMRGIKAWRNACWKPGSQCIGLELMTSTRQWKSVEFASQLPELPGQLETSVKFHPMHGTPWELTCSTGTEWTFLWLVITLQNSWLWGKIQILGMVFTEFGHPFVLKGDNGPCYSSGEFHDFLEFYQIPTSQAAHTTHKAMDLLKLWWEFQRNWWKSPSKMENRGIMDYSNTEWHPYWPPFHHHWKPSQTENWGLHFPRSLPALKSLENSRIHQELEICLPASTSTKYNMELKPL